MRPAIVECSDTRHLRTSGRRLRQLGRRSAAPEIASHPMVHEAGTMMQRFAALLTTVWRALAFALGGSFADIPRLGPRVRFPLESGHPGLSVHAPVSHCGQFAISV